MLRKCISAFVVLILFSMFAGSLGTANAQENQSTEPRQGSITISGTMTLWHDYAPGSAAETALNQVILNAETDYPDLTVNAAYHSDLLADFIVASQPSSAFTPDILLGSSDWVGDLARAGYIAKIDTLLTGNLTNVTQSAINSNMVNGFLYGVPKQAAVVALYYNKSTIPVPPATSAELLSMLQNDGKSIAGAGDAGSYFYHGFWDAFGGQLMDGTGRCIADQGGYDLAMQYLLDLQTAGASLATDYGNAETMFLNGSVDMLINGPEALADYSAALGADLGVAILPSGPSGAAHAFTDTYGFYINPHAYNRPYLVNLALYMTNQASSQIFTDVGGDIPVRTDVTSSDPLINTFAQIFIQDNPRPKVPQMFNYWTPFNKMVINVLTGIETPQVGVQRACNTMNVLNGFTPSTNTVNLWYPYESGSGEETALLQVVDNAHAADPSITIVPINKPLDSIYTDYETAVLSGGGPDMYIAPNDVLGDQVRAGAVLNIDSYLQGNLTNVSQAAIDGMTIDGQLYGVPESTKAVALYYNKSMISTPPTTTAELLALLQSGETIASPRSGSFFLYGLWNAFGGQLMDVDGLCIADQGGYDLAMQYLLDLQTAGANLEIDYATAQADFLNGQVGMLVNGPWVLADLEAALGSDLGVVLLPSGPADIAKPISGIDGFYVNPNTTNTANAIDLALYMTSQASSQIFTDVGGHIPARSDVSSVNPLINTFAQASALGEPRLQSMKFSNYWAPFGNMFTDVLAGTVTPSVGVQHACITMNGLNGFFPIVTSINRAFADVPVSVSILKFELTFSSPVTDVDVADFSLTTSGVLGATVSGVVGSGSYYIVSILTGSGSGTIKLNIVDNDSILDASTKPLGGIGTGNGDFTTGETQEIIKYWIFGDVTTTNWAMASIERLYNAGITGGCTQIPLNYCPLTPVSRAQMAIFLLRGMHGSTYTPPAATGTIFTDVPLGSFGAAWIEQLAVEGITSGCGSGNYCPTTPVSRAQMAIFLVRAKHGIAFVPSAATGIFPDVPVGSFGANYIEQLVADAITSGCGFGNYCPNTMVKRDSMAVFLVKTFNLP